MLFESRIFQLNGNTTISGGNSTTRRGAASHNRMPDLFERDRSVITKRIRNIFGEQEVDEKSNVNFAHCKFG